ncbi:MAG TPA: type II secretion system F family protein [Acidimicrobiales bacterium]|nr:type II secretion system F family protein [Acidimicrobiales bacterium]
MKAGASGRGVALAAALALGAALAPSVLAAGAAGDPLPVSADVSGYPDVRLVVAAPAEMGDQLLTASSFRVVEGGQPQSIQVDALPADQLEVALVLDTSGSMAGAPLAAAKSAAQAFLAQLPAGARVAVIGFGAKAAVVSPLSANRSAQQAAVAGLSAGGQTALYDAVGAGLAQLSATAGTRPVVVLLSDGGDTTSKATLDATAAALAASKVPLFAVELRTGESNPAALSRLAASGGGRVVPAGDPAALGGAFDAVARQLVRQYAIGYRSSGHGPTDVDVNISSGTVQVAGRAQLSLPAMVDAGPPASADPAGDGGTTGRPLGSWALFGGAALWALVLLGALLAASSRWAPRARGLVSRRRGLGLSGAARRAESLTDAVLRSRGGSARLATTLEAGGVDVRVGELLLAVGAAAAVVFVAGWLLISALVGLVAALVVLVVARVVVEQLARRRRARFGDQLADTLQMLAGSLRAGHSLAQAIDTLARESESPTAEEFRRVTVETRLGRDFVESLSALRGRVGNEDFEWVVEAVEIQREVGGDLAEILDKVTGTIRDRTRIRRKVTALSAEGRLSAAVLMVLPFGLAGVMAVTNRSYLSPLFGTGLGLAFLAAGAVLLAVGGVWLRRIVKPIF